MWAFDRVTFMWLGGFGFLHWIHRFEYFLGVWTFSVLPTKFLELNLSDANSDLADEEILPSPTPFLSQMDLFLTFQPYSFKIHFNVHPHFIIDNLP